ncbi:unnamed protein product [Colias eurytheme]|nr:unnamed protein product [Colias eurytheme]
MHIVQESRLFSFICPWEDRWRNTRLPSKFVINGYLNNLVTPSFLNQAFRNAWCARTDAAAEFSERLDDQRCDGVWPPPVFPIAHAGRLQATDATTRAAEFR